MKTHPLPVYLQRFFTERLVSQLQASSHTVASYRDTFRLLLNYASDRLRRMPTDLQVADIDAPLVGHFLSFVETTRGNSARSRNTRLSAIRSFFKYVAINEPQLLQHCQKILAIPSKRYEKRTIDYLDRDEIEALLAAPDLASWYGRRDRALLLLALQTGLRVSELISLDCRDVVLGTGAHVRCQGKGRKERTTPLRKYVQLASAQCPTLKSKRVSPHVLRHSAAMDLLHHGVDCTVIALWLGHEHVETTQMYLHADLQLKERAMDQTKPVEVPAGRYKPAADVMAFLEGL